MRSDDHADGPAFEVVKYGSLFVCDGEGWERIPPSDPRHPCNLAPEAVEEALPTFSTPEVEE